MKGVGERGVFFLEHVLVILVRGASSKRYGSVVRIRYSGR